ncbi:MAG: RNA polymerase sigma factor region1.1 domain-containing protein [Candidatus Saccharibacteria bacterium]
MAKKANKPAAPEGQRQTPEEQQKAKADLLEQGKKDGKLDARDIAAKISDTPENVEILDALYTELGEAGVEITDARRAGRGRTERRVADRRRRGSRHRRPELSG